MVWNELISHFPDRNVKNGLALYIAVKSDGLEMLMSNDIVVFSCSFYLFSKAGHCQEKKNPKTLL